jgi:dsRNA-specific ribonuclease
MGQMRVAVCITVEDLANLNVVSAMITGIRVYSMIEIILAHMPNISMPVDISDRVDTIVKLSEGKLPYLQVTSMTDYSKILFMSPNYLVVGSIGSIFGTSAPAKDRDLLLLDTNKMLYPLLQMSNRDNIVDLLVDCGYQWNSFTCKNIQPVNDTLLRSILNSQILADELGYKEYLIEMLSRTIDPTAKDIVSNLYYIFSRTCIHRSVNKFYNYELLEAYGDRFLAGSFARELAEVPGVLTPEQVGVISSYYQDKYRLEKVCDKLGITKYITVQLSDSYTENDYVRDETKIKSDVIEALIGAIRIAWDRSKMDGDNAVRKFIVSTFLPIKNIDVNNIKYYIPPQEIVTKMVEKNLKRSLLKEEGPYKHDGKIYAAIYYNDRLMGEASISAGKASAETENREVLDKAYQAVIDSKSLSKYIKQQYTIL